MTEQEIIRESSFYKWFVEQMELAEARGMANGGRKAFLNLLRVRFGDPLPQPVLDQVSAADFDTLLRWSGQIVSATTWKKHSARPRSLSPNPPASIYRLKEIRDPCPCTNTAAEPVARHLNSSAA
jgi:hypothetical protein